MSEKCKICERDTGGFEYCNEFCEIQGLRSQLAEAREEEASLIKWLDQERQDWGSSEKDSWNPYHRVLSKLKEKG